MCALRQCSMLICTPLPDEGLHVVVDGAALPDSRNNRREVVVSQDHVRGLLGNLSAYLRHGKYSSRAVASIRQQIKEGSR